jgi:hypothetical protein
MNQQEDLSKSYTDSISSYLYEPIDEAYSERPTSIHSSQSHYNTTGYTTPIIAIPKGRSMIDLNDRRLIGRRGSAFTISSYYDSIGEEDGDYGTSCNVENEDDAITPLPKLQMLIVSIILFSEPLTSTILFPFIYFMVYTIYLNNKK